MPGDWSTPKQHHPRFLHTETACISTAARKRVSVKGLPGGHSEREPPDPIPNSEVKLLSADDSVVFHHAKVGHCQAFNPKPREPKAHGVFLYWQWTT
jgi:hypothetical protein